MLCAHAPNNIKQANDVMDKDFVLTNCFQII